MKLFDISDLDALEIGAAILGSGGGGDPAIDKQAARIQLEKYGPVKIMSLDELNDDDLVVPIGAMGAPSVSKEMLPSGDEFSSILEAVERYFQKKPTALVSGEIGGSNAFVPFLIAGKYQLPVLDGDGIGRAFPKLQMNAFNLAAISPSPAFIADVQGNRVTIELAENDDNAVMLESMARNVVIACGSSAAIALYTMSGAQAKRALVRNSLTRAITIGKSIVQAYSSDNDPIERLVHRERGAVLARGIIEDVNQRITEGFLKGSVYVTEADGSTVCIEYQNEHLVAEKNGNMLACTPDILMLLDEETVKPITVDMLKYGLRVVLITLPCDPLWKTPQGLNLVGPRAFGYHFDYVPFAVEIS